MKFFRQENTGKFYRQGDVGLQEVDFLPDGVSEVFPGGRIVLEALARVIEEVAKDARRKPKEFLRDTLVRKGGE